MRAPRAPRPPKAPRYQAQHRATPQRPSYGRTEGYSPIGIAAHRELPQLSRGMHTRRAQEEAQGVRPPAGYTGSHRRPGYSGRHRRGPETAPAQPWLPEPRRVFTGDEGDPPRRPQGRVYGRSDALPPLRPGIPARGGHPEHLRAAGLPPVPPGGEWTVPRPRSADQLPAGVGARGRATVPQRQAAWPVRTTSDPHPYYQPIGRAARPASALPTVQAGERRPKEPFGSRVRTPQGSPVRRARMPGPGRQPTRTDRERM